MMKQRNRTPRLRLQGQPYRGPKVNRADRCCDLCQWSDAWDHALRGDGSPTSVFDLMEPEWPKVDQAVLSFLKSEALHPADFMIREDGVVRLNPELARTVLQLAV
jgi:hypothetical protein